MKKQDHLSMKNNDKEVSLSANAIIGDQSKPLNSLDMFSDKFQMVQDQNQSKNQNQMNVKDQTLKNDMVNELSEVYFNDFNEIKIENENEIKISQNQDSQQKQIFQSKNMIKLTIKNTNIPKFIVKTFRDWINTHEKQIQRLYLDKNIRKQLHNAIAPISLKRKNQFRMQNLKKLFGDQGMNSIEFKKVNRYLLNQILRNCLKEQIIDRQNIKQTNKISYLIALKVYALRCMKSPLISRVQSR